MAYKHHIRSIMAFLAIFCICIQASALSTSRYATNSKLASGHWVKVKVDKNGIYELTYDELNAMGFSSPEKVRIYGQGGHILSESLNGSQTDDLAAVPYAHANNKIFFYAKGPVKITMGTSGRFSRSINSYATCAYYFITEETSAPNTIKSMTTPTISGSNLLTTSYNCVYHESEKISYLSSGRDLYGESLPASITITPTGRVAGSEMTVQTYVAAAATSAGTSLTATLGNTEVPFDATAAALAAPAGYDNFRLIQPYASVTPDADNGSYTLTVGVANTAALSKGALDYAIVTYTQENSLGSRSQMNINYSAITKDDKIGIYNEAESLQIWNVTDPQTPLRVSYRNTSETIHDDVLNENFDVTRSDASLGVEGVVSLVAFDPAKTLYKIKEYEVLPNQNIHGAPTPDMVIICPTQLLAKAERLAQIHRDHDNYDVLVLDQKDIFNEFSSGTPDAMAYRLMLKMFYDRNPEKLKHLLLFGGGYFDNRQLSKQLGENYLLTFQSSNSYNIISTYVSDDFFGTLGDNTGLNITAESVNIGVGRLPVLNEQEADQMIDKIEAYINNTDYSNWRNKILIMEESGDDNIHMYQGADLLKTLATTSSADIDVKKYHIESFILSNGIARGAHNGVASVLQLAEFFQQGALYVTYMGHGGGGGISNSGVWNINKVLETPIPRLPVISMAACDIANFDSGVRGIGEIMVLTPERGAIGLFTTTRTVEANENHIINSAFMKAMLTLNDDGTARTLGEAYKLAKQAYGSAASRNKMCYTLFADPALRPSVPRPLIAINTINGTAATDATVIKPMAKTVITGQINTASGNIDTDFNGEVTVSIYDAEVLFKSFTYASVDTDVYHNRQLITETTAKVTNGAFTVELVVPKECQAGKSGVIKVYAHNLDNSQVVNGANSNFTFAEYDEKDPETIIDTEAPAIVNMYINDETAFANEISVGPDFNIFIEATDNVALSNQSQTIGRQMTLTLDGYTLFNEVRGYAKIDEGGKQVTVAMPINSISEGQHALTFTVYDAAGNVATRDLSFVVVKPDAEAVLTVEESPARESATFNFEHKFTTEPTVKITVIDADKKVVWQQDVTSFPYVWDLNDANGNRVPAGIYQFYGTASTSSQYSGTEKSRLVIIDK